MLADLIDVERCSIYLYNKSNDELYCKVITGRLKEPISFSRQTDKANPLIIAFNTGKSQHLSKINALAENAPLHEILGDYT